MGVKRRRSRHNGRVLASLRGMPWGIAVFLAYGFLILAAVGLSMGPVIDQATAAPVTLIGVVWMALLAYTIFTITLVLQRKRAARGLAIALSTLTLPAIPLAALTGSPVAVLFVAILAFLLFNGLRTRAVRAWLDQD
jgi:succinate-acetate transporter protein